MISYKLIYQLLLPTLHLLNRKSQLIFPLLLQLGGQTPPQNLSARCLWQSLQVVNATSHLLVARHLPIEPLSDAIQHGLYV